VIYEANTPAHVPFLHALRARLFARAIEKRFDFPQPDELRITIDLG
jgi:hypothetical protein